MCRHLAYLGPASALRSLLIDPPHGLYRQSWAPRRQRHGTVNADGFGVGWYADGDPVPARYRRGTPIWGDSSLPDIARVTRSGAVLAAVRSATPGMALGEAAAAPFASGPWLFSHNGILDGWPGSAKVAPVTAGALASMEAMTDSALLWALVLDRLRAGAAPGAALSATIAAVESAGGTGRFNFLLTDGVTIAATACGDTLWYRAGPAGNTVRTDAVPADAGLNDTVLTDTVLAGNAVLAVGGDMAVVVASEPSDDRPGWIEVPDRQVLSALPGRVDVRPLGPPASAPPTPSPPTALPPHTAPLP
jgi:gamma-glutamyl hercynylcysteine S-oxide hydrolase